MTFAEWAVAVGISIADHLGARNVVEEIGDDFATWTFGANSMTAKLRPGTPFVDVAFARGVALWFVLGGKPELAAARIIPALMV
jgi:hypothetical protein